MNAAELIHQVEALGGRLRPRGDRLRMEAPRALPDTLIDELRQHKGEVMALLEGAAVSAIVDEDVLTSQAWDTETHRLIEWFLATEPPAEPFELMRGVTIAHPGKCWEYLRQDIAAGPGRGRSYYGAFEGNLRRLYELFGPGRYRAGA